MKHPAELRRFGWIVTLSTSEYPDTRSSEQIVTDVRPFTLDYQLARANTQIEQLQHENGILRRAAKWVAAEHGLWMAAAFALGAFADWWIRR